MMMNVLGGITRLALLITVLGTVAACGDAPTPDKRGYTKAPLENPGLRIEPEPVTEMSELAEPIRPPIVELETPAPEE